MRPSMPPGGMEWEPPPPDGWMRRLLLHATRLLNQCNRALNLHHESMEEKAPQLSLNVTCGMEQESRSHKWHGGAGDCFYCKHEYSNY